MPVRPYPEKRNHLNFANISPTVAIDTSMKRSSRVPTTAFKPPKNYFLLKKLEILF